MCPRKAATILHARLTVVEEGLGVGYVHFGWANAAGMPRQKESIALRMP